MPAQIARRIVYAIPVLFVVSVVVFALVLMIPGDPAVTLAGDNATAEQVERIRQELGLDRGLVAQYVDWLSSALRGDLGTSLYSSQSVVDAITQRIPVTVSLAGGAIAISIVIGIPTGILAGYRKGTATDRAATLGATIGVALPNYFLGMLLVLVFAIRLGWLPATSFVPIGQSRTDWFKHLLLPWITLGTSGAAVIARQMRSAMIGVLDQDYIRSAKAKGLLNRRVLFRHALPNAAIPVVTVIGAQVAVVLGGSIIIEQVFGFAGVGQLAVTAVLRRDMPTIQGVVLFYTLIVVVVNIVVDSTYTLINPKVRTI